MQMWISPAFPQCSCCNSLSVVMSSLSVQLTNLDTSYLLPSFIPTFFLRPLHAILTLAQLMICVTLGTSLHSNVWAYSLISLSHNYIIYTTPLLWLGMLPCPSVYLLPPEPCITYSCLLGREKAKELLPCIIGDSTAMRTSHFTPLVTFNLPRPNTCNEVIKYYVLRTSWHWW